MSRNCNALVGKWFLLFGESKVDYVSQVIEQVGQNLFLTECENLHSGQTSLVTRSAGGLDGLTWYNTREQAMERVSENGAFIWPR
jgi:hypothetical protein